MTKLINLPLTAVAVSAITSLTLLSSAPASLAAPKSPVPAHVSAAHVSAAHVTPAHVTPAVAAGTDIGNAGVLTASASGSLADGSDDWWVVYPATKGGTVSVTIDDTTPSSAPCTDLSASLDATGGSDDNLQSGSLHNSGDTEELTGSQGGSDRYFIEVTPDPPFCTPAGGQPVTYTVTVDSGGGGKPPALGSGSIAAGGSIGSAWPPLQGAKTYKGTIGSATPDSWYVVFKKPTSTLGTIRVTNTTVAGSTSCGRFSLSLYNTDGTGGTLSSGDVVDNSATTLSVPAKEPADAQGRYYLEIVNDGNFCSSALGETYSIVLEPKTQWSNPAKVPTAGASPGGSIGGAWPPLQGGTSYTGTIGTATPDSWFVLYKKGDSTLGTIRVSNTTVAGSTSCGRFFLALYDNTGTLDALSTGDVVDNSVTTLSVPANEPSDPQGRYFVEIVNDGNFCSSALGETYSIEPEASTEWANPAKPAAQSMPAGPSMKAAGGPLAATVSYGGSLGTASSADWTFFHANGSMPVTARIEDTTESSDNCQAINYALETSAGSVVDSGTLGDDGADNLVVSAAGDYYVELTVNEGCAPQAPLSANVIVTPTAGVRGPVLTVTDPTLPKATIEKAYSATIDVTSGTAPYKFAVETALPPGLKLSTTTGVISGTPTKQDTYTFMVKITDSAQPAHSITAQITIKVSG